MQIFGNQLPKMDFQKYLFLFNEGLKVPFYEFLPYKYGCFSFQANQDMSTMTKYQLVEERDSFWYLKSEEDFLGSLKTSDRIKLVKLYREYKDLRGDELVKYVYEHSPYFAINSVIAERILSDEEFKSVVNSRPQNNSYEIITIGYEGKTVEHFTNELINRDIRILCDVRKNALSMKYGFSKKQLKYIVENVGIKYIHIPELGIISEKRQELKSREDYEKLFDDYEENTLPGKTRELEELLEIFNTNKRIALMCFESDHNFCHRTRTVNALIKLNKKETSVIHL